GSAMTRAVQSLLLLAFGLIGLAFLAASWRLDCAEAYFFAGLFALVPGLGFLLLSAIGWQCLDPVGQGQESSSLSG
ncbi:MAG: hypothetical protein Q8R28_17970, partial [Dehalococcoidia bacterium]|nr:hypothetical protein [Dehalococcoidia bacterium]